MQSELTCCYDTLADLKFKPEALLELVGLVEAKTISSSAAQQVFAEMFDTGKTPAVIVQEKGLAQVSDTGAIEKFCDEAIAANPNPVADYKAGKVAALNSLKGQVMKLSKGKANPALVGEILERKLESLNIKPSRRVDNCRFKILGVPVSWRLNFPQMFSSANQIRPFHRHRRHGHGVRRRRDARQRLCRHRLRPECL